jgi:nucleotide-binding universal stress UspA family protein
MPASKQILFPTDFSVYANHAYQYAIGLAKKRGGTIHLLHVLDVNLFTLGSGHGIWLAGSDMARVEQSMTEHAESRLNHLAEQAAEHGVNAKQHIVKGSPGQTISEQAAALGCGLVVLATHGRSGIDHLVFGSTAERVVRESPIPVLAVKHPEHEFVDPFNLDVLLKRILFPTDFSPYSERGLPYAVHLCKEFGATLVLLHINDLPLILPEYLPELSASPTQDLEQYGLESLERLAGEITGAEVETLQATGRPHTEIAKVVEDQDIDLVVMPTHGRGGISHLLLGSVAEKVIRSAKCPVLTVRPDKIPSYADVSN